jgi:hypothetical protein
VLTEFCEDTQPAQLTPDHWQPLVEGER